MLETAHALAGGAAILLILAGGAWAYPQGRPQLRLVDGGSTRTDLRQHAAYLLLSAFGISAVAAFLAIAG